MRISEAQIQNLLQIALGSLKISDNAGHMFIYNDKQRFELVKDILSQQDNIIREFKDETLPVPEMPGLSTNIIEEERSDTEWKFQNLRYTHYYK